MQELTELSVSDSASGCTE